MRLTQDSSDPDSLRLREFSKFILSIGDGKIGEEIFDGEFEVKIPDDLLIPSGSDPIEAITNSTYPDFINRYHLLDYFGDRAILAPTLEDVGEINDYMLDRLPGEEKVYLSADSICLSDTAPSDDSETYTTEFLNSVKGSGLPNHMIILKVGAPIMLIRNVDRSLGLCNGTRLIVSRLSDHVIEAVITSGKFTNEKVLIARMNITPSDFKLPFKFQRRQFPIMLCFAMTINKSQGQTLSNVGLYLRRPVFSHGQLYVAISRVRSRDGLKILICHDDGALTGKTKNVVYREVLQSIC